MSVFVLVTGLVFLVVCGGTGPLVVPDDEEMVNVEVDTRDEGRKIYSRGLCLNEGW